MCHPGYGFDCFGFTLVISYFQTGSATPAQRLPTAVPGTGMMLLGFLSLACGLILDTVTRGRIEMKRLHYLSLRGQPNDNEIP
jgi:hypothetical protein